MARLAQGVARALFVALGLIVVASGVLAVRLSLGKLTVTALARHFARHGEGGTRIGIGAATLAWLPRAPGAPLILNLADTVLRRPDGSVVASLTHLTAGLAPAPLLIGLVRPTSLTVDGASLALRRAADGTLGLDTGSPPKGASPPATRTDTFIRLADLTLTNIAASVADRPLGLTWRVQASRVAATGLDGTHPAGDAALTLAAGSEHGTLTARFASTDGTRQLVIGFSAIDPAKLGLPQAEAGMLPDLPLAGSVTAILGPGLAPRQLDASLAAGSGTIPLAGGALPILGARASLSADLAAGHATLTSLQAALAPGTDSPPPMLHATGGVDWHTPTAMATLSLTIDRLAFAALGRYWPPQAAPGARGWMVANATAGTARDVHLALGLARSAAGAITLTSATGGLRTTDLTLSWLRPVPPLTDVAATLTLVSPAAAPPDAILIDIASANQAPSEPADPPLRLTHGTFRITGLSQKTQTGALEADIAGPVPQAIALLSVKRLHLLADHPIALGAPAGTLSAHLRLSLPLEARVTMAQIPIASHLAVSDLHLGGVIAGRDIDHGQLMLDATEDGLAIAGTADLAGIPSTLKVALDFRAGSPSQVVARYDAQGSASLAQIEQAGLPAGGLVDGNLSYVASLTELRAGAGHLTAHIDLHAASLRVASLGWSQPQGGDGTADASILLDHDHIVAVDHLAVLGPKVDVLAHAEYAAGQPVAVDFDHIVLGNTRAAGILRLPAAPAPVHLVLHGSRLDLVARMQGAKAATPSRADAAAAARGRAASAAAHPPRGRPWVADLTFDRVDLGPADALTAIRAHAENDGLLVRRATVSGAAGTGRFVMHLAPDGDGRRLTGTATDAGALMAALDLTGAARGGTLALDARYDDTHADHPLTGTAKIDTFRIVGATAVARLLQAMTLYGLVDVLRGPGLGITHLVVPFGFADQVLTLNNARAWSSSLGFTARGQIDLAAQRADLTGTVIPGYFFNTLPGKLPLIGKLFSPEKGGGLFAATYALTGPLARPNVSLNPLAALAPGLLRGLASP